MIRLGPVISNHGKVVSLDAERFKRQHGTSLEAALREVEEAAERVVAIQRRAMAAADEIASVLLTAMFCRVCRMVGEDQ